MSSLFGKLRNRKPKPTLSDTSDNLNNRDNNLSLKIQKLDAELKRYKAAMQKTDNETARSNLRKRAGVLLKQRQVYIQQRDALLGQVVNIDTVKFAEDSLRDNVQMADAMKAATQSMRKTARKIDAGKVGDIFDDMEEILEDNQEIQEIMSRDLNMMQQIDEDELIAEFEDLDEQDFFIEEVDAGLLEPREKASAEKNATPDAGEKSEAEKLKEDLGV